MFDSQHGNSVKTFGPFVKRPEHQADCSPPSCAEIKSEWSHACCIVPCSCYLPQCIPGVVQQAITVVCLPVPYTWECCESHTGVFVHKHTSVRFSLTQHFLITIHSQLHVSALFNQQQAVFSCRRGSTTASVRPLQMWSHRIAL